MYSKNCSTFWGGVVHDVLYKWAALESCAITQKTLTKKKQYLKVLFKSFRDNLKISASLCGSTEIHLWSDTRKHDRHACKLKLQHEDAMQSKNTWCQAEFESASVTACDIFCKSLVFGFVNADSFCYFDNIYDLQIKFISEYLRHMVICCKKPDRILWILWGDIHDLSQILQYSGNISTTVYYLVG